MPNNQTAFITVPVCDCQQRAICRSRIRGQGLTEYVIIIAIIAIAAIGATSFFGDSIKASFLALGSELTGNTKVDMVQETSTALAKAKSDTNTQTTLRNYRD